MSYGVYERTQKMIENMKKVDRHWLKGNKHALKKNAGYAAIHYWMENNFGKPDHCDLCGLTEQKETKNGRNYFEWSSRSGETNRELQNWWQLCIKCHRNYDIAFLGAKTGRLKYK